MKKAFTLVELLTVLIIVGILGTLGLAQYSRTIEKSRASEAWDVIGHIRKIAASYYQQYDTVTPISGTPSLVNIGALANHYPGTTGAQCRATHYFYYSVAAPSAPRLCVYANRCGGAGKGGATQWAALQIQDCMDFSLTADDVKVIPSPYN